MVSEVISEKSEDEVANVLRVGGVNERLKL